MAAVTTGRPPRRSRSPTRSRPGSNPRRGDLRALAAGADSRLGVTPPAPSSDTVAMDGTDDRRTILVIAVALVSFVVVAAAGTAGFVIGARTPKLDSQSESANLRGGAIVVRGVSHNTGAGVAQNVVIQVAVDLGGGLNIDVGSSTVAATGEGVGSANLGDIAAGMDRPYSVSIPIGDRSAATDLKYLAEPRWDKPSLDTADLSFSVSYSGSHVIDHVTGKVKNAGKGPAPNASITFSESADKAGNSLLGEATSKLGDVAAGADLPFQLAVDLGANPPNDLYYSSTFTFDAAKVADEQETAKRVGGTLTLTGFLRNSGAV